MDLLGRRSPLGAECDCCDPSHTLFGCPTSEVIDVLSLSRRRATVAVLVASSLLTAACGLKEETKDSLAAGGGVAGGAVIDPDTGEVIGGGEAAGEIDAGAGAVDPGTGTVADPGTGTGTTGQTGTTGGTGGTGTTTTQQGGGTNAETAPSAAPEMPGDDGDTTGIKGNTLYITLHGPLTGAGVPQESFKTGAPKFWKKHKLANGMSVVAEAVDDKYNAPDAVRACNRAAKESFMILGGAGTDQISACAQSPVLRRGGVPYLSAGVTEVGLGGLSHYFANSLTYRQQGPLVVQMAEDFKFLRNRKWAVVITDTPNFKDARESILTALKAKGITPKVFLTDKAPSNCTSLAGQIRAQYDAIYFLGQPSFFAQCVGSIGYTPTYKPIYTGPGPSFGIQSVGKLACGGTANQYQAYYLHPLPGMDRAKQLVPDETFADDIEFQIYASMQGLKSALDMVKGKLTREKFISTLFASGVPAGIGPATAFNGKTRFGGTAAYALKMDCSAQIQRTLKLYKKAAG